MIKFIYNNFELDLSHLNITFNWKNQWIDSDLNSEYSFPFEMHESQWAKFVNLTSFNSVAGNKEFVGILYREGNFEKATLKLQSKLGGVISAVIFVGLEDFPTFNKKLNELQLESFPVIDLKAHALSLRNVGYPNVNYAFPSVHSDKYDPSSDEFRDFVCLNFFENDAYVENGITPGTNLDSIKNIMQPLPNAFYVLKKVIEEAGYTLNGDVLSIPDLKKTFIFRDGNYFYSTKKETQAINIKYTEYTDELNENSYKKVKYFYSKVIDKKGTYTLLGDMYVLQKKWIKVSGPAVIPFTGDLTSLSITIKIGTTTIFTFSRPITTAPDPSITIYQYDYLFKLPIDIDLDLNVNDILYIEVEELKRDVDPTPTPDYPEMAHLNLIATRYKNPDNSPIVSVQDLKEIDLNKCVPDLTCSEYVNAIRLSKNLDFKIVGNSVYMNFIKIDRSNSIDISNYEVPEPLQTFNDERSFELKYTDGASNKEHLYNSLFIDSSGYKVNNYAVNKNTEPISIDLLPYPLLNRNSINTAYAYDDENSKLRLVFFDHTVNSNYPACYENPLFDIENMYLNYWKDWLTNRINSDTFEWEFLITQEKYKLMMEKLFQFAFKNFHLFTEIEKQHINNDYFLISAKSETII